MFGIGGREWVGDVIGEELKGETGSIGVETGRAGIALLTIFGEETFIASFVLSSSSLGAFLLVFCALEATTGDSWVTLGFSTGLSAGFSAGFSIGFSAAFSLGFSAVFFWFFGFVRIRFSSNQQIKVAR